MAFEDGLCVPITIKKIYTNEKSNHNGSHVGTNIDD